MTDLNVLARTPQSIEFSNIITFLNQNLRPNTDWSIQQEYPSALVESNLHNMSVISDPTTAEVLSFAMLKPFICKTSCAIFKIGAIGSVVTKDTHQGQGLSKKNILNCMEKAEKQECDFIILWSDKYDFYRKFGFELAGFEHAFLVDQALPIQNKNSRFLKTNQVDPTALLRVYNQHTVNSVRTLDDVRSYLKIPQSVVHTMWSDQNQLIAYAIEGKGADLQSYIHEWGGSVPAILDLLSHMIQTEKKSYTFMCPHHSVNIKSKLQSLCSFSNEGFLGLIKINNFDRLALKIKKMFHAEGVHHIVCERKDSEIIFGTTEDLYTIKNENEFVKIVFGPTLVRDLQFITPQTATLLEKVFPIPLWVWGWDSI
jgi:N-acetylglutamate synthase-like GNAT family acetyltransferase